MNNGVTISPSAANFLPTELQFEGFICSQFWGEMGVESGFDLVVWAKIDQGTDVTFVDSCTGQGITT